MTPDRYHQLEELCHQALDKPAGERAAFVKAACAGDEALRRDLETLLASSEAAGSFLEHPPGDLAAAVLQHEEDRSADQQTLSHYRLRSRLGAGGMGEVHLAQDLQLGRSVALKLLPRELAEDREQRRRLVFEAQAASTLNHPNIAQIYEIGQTDDGARFIAMEYVPGRTLGSILRERRLPLAEAVTLAVQVADALEEAHAKGIVHRDIKPANVMVTPRGQVKVLDFGLAKMATLPAIPLSEGDPPGPMTAPGTVMGTAEYMSPEQALGLEVDCRSDVFSFGSMFYEMVTGRRPFWGRTRAETLDRVIHAEPAALAGLSPDAPAALASVVGRCSPRTASSGTRPGRSCSPGFGN